MGVDLFGWLVSTITAPFEYAVVRQVFYVAWITHPVWLPIVLLSTWIPMWMRFVMIQRQLETEYVLLEVKLPTEITQTPQAMETVLNAMYHTGEPSNLYEKYWEGKSRPEFSLEIASFEGRVHFFIWCRRKTKNLVEANIYSQYPTVEVYEAPDYAQQVQFDPKTMNLFGVEQKLKKPDPYPIKTYPAFGLDKETREEFKSDPIATILEFMGSFGKGEYCWMQIVIRSHTAERKKSGSWFEKVDWQDEAKRETQKILDQMKPSQEGSMPRQATEGENQAMKAIERNVEKKPFDTGIRVIYFADTEHFRSEKNAGLPTMFRNFESHTLNGFKPDIPVAFDYAWKDPFKIRSTEAKKYLYDAYRWRSFFKPPYRSHSFVLSCEELATLFHFPGRAVQVPSLERITSRRGEAPTNLPG
jgi:hypothetical protein